MSKDKRVPQAQKHRWGEKTASVLEQLEKRFGISTAVEEAVV